MSIKTNARIVRFVENIVKIYDQNIVAGKISNIAWPSPSCIVAGYREKEREGQREFDDCCIVTASKLTLLSPLLISAAFVHVDYWAFAAWILVDIFGSLCYYRMYGIYPVLCLTHARPRASTHIQGVQLLKHRKNHDPVQKPIRNWKWTSLPCGSAPAPCRKRQ